MKTLKKILFLLGTLLVIFLLVITIVWLKPVKTSTTTSPYGISKIEYVQIGSTEQCILTRSENIENPILLFLHGGPGMPMMYMAHEFQKELEKEFTVVQWDRRGAGKTFSHNIPDKESMNVRQLLSDTYELVDTLRKRHGKEKVILAGHSFGSYLGAIAATERPDLFTAFISIGQVVDDKKARDLQIEFIRRKAEEHGNADVLTALENEESYLESWLFKYGGELKESKTFFPLIWSGLKAPEYSLKEAIELAKGSSFSSAHMKYNVLDESPLNTLKEFKIPVYFLIGRYDFTTPHQLVEVYFQTISAPQKKIIYFSNSAHFPFFEEPMAFCDSILEILPELKIWDVSSAYFKTYEERKDFNAFLDFYDESAVLEDVVTGHHVAGKNNLRSFFDWNNPAYQNLHSQTLVFEEQILKGGFLLTRGYFTPFKWGDLHIDSMQFKTILTFNDEGKIIKQKDWIDYPETLVAPKDRKDTTNWMSF